MPGLNFEKLLSTKGSKRLFFSAAKHNIGFTTLPHKYFIEFYVWSGTVSWSSKKNEGDHHHLVFIGWGVTWLADNGMPAPCALPD